ncbi:hypothetical protein HYT33_03100 [Candidatus Roizmanbacteria bacterium]|nr:hypothetical protein [Candidatus Roizmanbacteria bacterium]
MGTSQLRHKLQEVFIIEPNDLGIDILTRLYKETTAFLKTMPFVIVVPVSFVIAVTFYLIFGPYLVKLVTILQNGF